MTEDSAVVAHGQERLAERVGTTGCEREQTRCCSCGRTTPSSPSGTRSA